MKALVFEGKIVQIEAKKFPVSPELTWHNLAGLTPQPKVGWSYDGAVFSPPSPPPIVPSLPDPGDELNASLVALKGTGATVDQLIDVLMGKVGKGRVAGRPV